jgi:hypothetical protein
MKCMVQEAKSPVENLVRQRWAEGFNSGIKGLNVNVLITAIQLHEYYLTEYRINIILCA